MKRKEQEKKLLFVKQRRKKMDMEHGHRKYLSFGSSFYLAFLIFQTSTNVRLKYMLKFMLYGFWS